VETYKQIQTDYIKYNQKFTSNYYSLILNIENFNRELFDKFIGSLNREKSNGSINDFYVILLIRILYLLKRDNQQMFTYVYNQSTNFFNEIKFWLTPSEKINCYWSENHIICYLSSWYLWDQLNTNTNDECLKMLKTYIASKEKYHLFEFLSPVYNPYTLSALLNLYDFSNQLSSDLDLDKIKSIIDFAVGQFISVQNNDGSTIAAAGRIYPEYKNYSGTSNFNKMLYICNSKPNNRGLSPCGSFFATTSYIYENKFSNEPLYKTYDNEPLYKTYDIGHNIEIFKEDPIYSQLDKYQLTIFQMSAGCYFNYETIIDTISLIDEYDLYDHKHFKIGKYKNIIKYCPKSIIKYGSYLLDTFTGGSVISHANYHVYKTDNIVLTSLNNFNAGKMGAQQFVWVANINGSSVYTESGSSGNIGNLKSVITNTHIPMIKQNNNVLIMIYKCKLFKYLTKPISKLDFSVFLKLNEKEFSEILIKEKWQFYKKNDSYIAIFSDNDLQLDDSTKFKYSNKLIQKWVIIVGSSSSYNNFEIFCNRILSEAKINLKNNLSSYKIGINFESINMEMCF
jgi:hypothetical protein